MVEASEGRREATNLRNDLWRAEKEEEEEAEAGRGGGGTSCELLS